MPSLDEYRARYDDLRSLSDADAIQQIAKVNGVDVGDVTSYLNYEPPGGDFLRQLKNSWTQTKQLGAGLGAAAAATAETSFGEGGLATGLKKAAVEKYKEIGNELQINSKASDSLSYSWEEAHKGNFGALVDWTQGAFGMGIGQIGQAIGTAGVGGIIGRTVGKKVVEGALSEMVEKEAKRLVLNNVAEDEAKKQAVGNVASRIGQNAAIGAQVLGMEGGEIGGDLAARATEEGRILTGAEIARALAATVVAAGPEAITERWALDAMTGKLPWLKAMEEASGVKGKTARAGMIGAAGATIGAGQEFTQTYIEEAGKGNEINNQTLRMAIDAAGMGAVGGAIPGAVGGLVTRPNEPAAQAPAEEAPPKPRGQVTLAEIEQMRTQRLAQLDQEERGHEGGVVTNPEGGIDVIAPRIGRELSPQEKGERLFLTTRPPEAIARRYGLEIAKPADAEIAAPIIAAQDEDQAIAEFEKAATANVPAIESRKGDILGDAGREAEQALATPGIVVPELAPVEAEQPAVAQAPVEQTLAETLAPESVPAVSSDTTPKTAMQIAFERAQQQSAARQPPADQAQATQPTTGADVASATGPVATEGEAPNAPASLPIFTGRADSTGEGWGATRGSLADGTKSTLLVDGAGNYFWGDWGEAWNVRGGDDTTVVTGQHKDFLPAKFNSTKEARAAAEKTTATGPVAPQTAAQAATAQQASIEAAPLAAPVEKRNPTRQERIAQMTPADIEQELYVSRATGIKNRRALDEDMQEGKKAVTFIDLDGLKYINDTLGHEKGNELLKKFADAMKAAGIDGYHVSGDEFAILSDDMVKAKKAIKALEAEAKKARIDSDTDSLQGITFSYGMSKDLATADANMQKMKASREQAGLRVRGGRPPNLVVIASQPAQPAPQQAPRGKRLQPFTDNRLSDPEARLTLQAMADAAGWAEVGGLLTRDAEGNVGRTKWIPRADWFGDIQADKGSKLTGNLKGLATRVAVQKALSGEPMTEAQKRHVTAMLEWKSQEQLDYEAQNTGSIDPFTLLMAAEDVGIDHGESLSDEALAARALEMDEEAVNRAMADSEYESEFLDEMRRIVDGEAQRQGEDQAIGGGSESVPGAEASPASEEGFSLTSQTEAQRVAEEARKKAEKAAKDKADAEAEVRARVDREARNFELGAPTNQSDLQEQEIRQRADEAEAKAKAEEAAGRKAAPEGRRGGGEQAPTGNTEDSGEELVYNRRNRTTKGITWEDIADKNVALRVKEVTKAKVYPKPDYQALIDSGINPTSVHLLKQVYDAIATAPAVRTTPTDDNLQEYIDVVNRVMDGATAWVSNSAAVAAWANNMLHRDRDTAVIAQKSMLETVFPDGWRNHQAGVRVAGGNRLLRVLQPSRDELQRAIADIKKGWPGKRESWQQRGYTIFHVEDPSALVIKSGDDGGHSVIIKGRVKSRHPDKAGADRAAADLAPWLLLDKLNRIVSEHQSEDAAIEAARAVVKRAKDDTEIKEVGRSVEEAERIGEARRLEGENVSSDQLQETFGFKGVNFGTWMKGTSPAKVAERQLHLNHAYDAFLDLAEILGVPPKAMSLNGLLGLAFGAQGGGKALAHFVPGVNEINLTRTNGAGALAHEFGHALDHYFAILGGLDRAKEPYLTENYSQKTLNAELRPEIVDRFKAVVEAMERRQETQQEASERQGKTADRLTKDVDLWLKSIRQKFEYASKPGAQDMEGVRAETLNVFDGLADRVRNLDVGDGRVANGRASTVFPVIGQIGAAYKDSFGRRFDNNLLGSLQITVSALISAKARMDATETHEPQRIYTDYKRQSVAADKKKAKPYWSSPREMFARAFDAFVVDTLAENAAKNSYLAGIEAVPPTGEERQAITAAFKALVGAIETKETDKGVALFSRAAGTINVDGIDRPTTNSEGQQGKHTVASVTSDIEAKLGKGALSKIADNFRIVKDMAALKADMEKLGSKFAELVASKEGFLTKGLYDPSTDTSYIVAGNLSAKDSPYGIFLHEVGEHYGLEKMLGQEAYAGVLNQAQMILRAGGKAMREAAVRVNASEDVGLDPDAKNFHRLFADKMADNKRLSREVIAYLADNPKNHDMPFMRRIMVAVREFMRKLGFTKPLTTDDIVSLITTAARRSGEFSQRRGEASTETIKFGGAARPTTNSEGQRIHPTEEGLRNFWRWFSGSAVTDEQGRPLAVYHGTDNEFTEFSMSTVGTGAWRNRAFGKQNASRAGDAIYMTSSRDHAAEFGDNSIPLYADIKNPLTVDAAAILDDYYKETRDSEDQGIDEWLEGFFGNTYQAVDADSLFNDAIRKAKREGRDGVIVDFGSWTAGNHPRSPEIGKIVIAFRPEQIKSAIGNQGGYDPSDPSILRSAGQRTAAQAIAQQPLFSRKNLDEAGSLVGSKFTLPAETFAQKAQRLAQDEANRFQVVQDAVVKQGGTVDESSNIADAIKRYPGRLAAAMKDTTETLVEPFAKRIHDAGTTTDEVSLLAYAEHAPERNAEIAKINPRFPNDGTPGKSGSGMTDQEAADIIKQVKAMPNAAEMFRLSQELRDITDQNLDNLVAGGEMEQSQADEYRKRYKFYVPLKGFELVDESGMTQPTGKGLSTGSRLGFRAMGRESRAGQIFEHVIQDYENGLMLSEKAVVAKTLRNFIKANPDDALWTIDNAPKKPRIEKGGSLYQIIAGGNLIAETASKDYADKQVQALLPTDPTAYVAEVKPSPKGLVKWRDSPFDPEEEIRFIENGKPVRIQLADAGMVRSYNRLWHAGVSDGLRLLNSYNGWLRQMYTQKNPQWFFMNAQKDILSVIPYVTGEAGIKTALKIPGNIPGAFKAAWAFHHGQTAGAKWNALIEQFKATGGYTGFAFVGDIEAQTSRLNGAIARHTGWDEALGKFRTKGAKAGISAVGAKVMNTAFFSWIEAMNSTFENMTRLAVFKSALDSGMTPNEAGKLAKNASTNFNTRGEWGPNINAVWLFANAGIQGTRNVGHALMFSPHKEQVWALMGGLVALGVMAGLMSDDDDDLLDDQIRSKSLVFKVGDTQLSLPMPYGFGFFSGFGQLAAQAMKHPEKRDNIALKMATLAFDHFSPVGDPLSGEADLKNVVNIAPTSIRPVLNVAANVSPFGGGPLFPESPYDETKPDSTKMWTATRGTGYDNTAKWLNALTGGDQYKAGAISVSPETLKLSVSTLFGGAGKLASDVLSLPFDVASETIAPSKVPLLKNYIREVDQKAYLGRFYEQAQEAQDAYTIWRRYLKAGMVDEATSYKQGEAAMISMGGLVSSYRKQIKALRDLESMTVNSDISSTEKNLRLAKTNAAIVQITTAFDERLKDFR